MAIPTRAQGCVSKGLLLSASVLALWTLQNSQAALHIQKIPEEPLKNQDLLLSVQGIPGNFQDFNWYQGEKTDGGTMLFSYIPGLKRPQRDGSAMKQRDIVGLANGSMLLRHIQPNDSGLYQVVVTINPSWTMKAKTTVQVMEKHEQLSKTHIPVNMGIMVAIVIGSLAAGALLIGCFAYFLIMKGWKSRNHRQYNPLSLASGDDNNIYEVMPSPMLLVSPLRDTRPTNPATHPPLPAPLQPEPENHHYQDLLNPDPAPYCQLVPAP
ncbi:PREDICTED: carcinoembryonic antigen-related cell adhesion molecule 19 [Elephantulus edwardii]|uniref:carcinoembryonic antigen-related cell adhesion molecule 19 n=1 Tax=Elephantulus edwardii TaxID=28737 RepID=UPI0003F0E4AF|nr:PREDICTED: carcinoembryonic antigen-related cell adhesion molecule 19 [Elephantulus edwardii]